MVLGDGDLVMHSIFLKPAIPQDGGKKRFLWNIIKLTVYGLFIFLSRKKQMLISIAMSVHQRVQKIMLPEVIHS